MGIIQGIDDEYVQVSHAYDIISVIFLSFCP